MHALWAFGWLFFGLAKAFAWEDVAAESRDAGYVLVEDGQVEAQDGSTGGGPP